MKVVINTTFGGFGLSEAAIERFFQLNNWVLEKKFSDYGVMYFKDKAIDENYFSEFDIPRYDPFLVQVVEELQENANSEFSSLKIVEIPDGIDFTVEEYDGREWIAETHRTWQ